MHVCGMESLQNEHNWQIMTILDTICKHVFKT